MRKFQFVLERMVTFKRVPRALWCYVGKQITFNFFKYFIRPSEQTLPTYDTNISQVIFSVTHLSFVTTIYFSQPSHMKHSFSLTITGAKRCSGTNPGATCTLDVTLTKWQLWCQWKTVIIQIHRLFSSLISIWGSLQ